MSDLLAIEQFLASTSGKKVLVLGDVMLDQYLSGKVNRISPEAPVPVLDHDQTQHTPGGAANVALNVVGLENEVWIWSAVGKDRMGERLKDLLTAQGVQTDQLWDFQERMTTCKTRIMSGNQHLLRVDQEHRQALAQAHLDEMLTGLEKVLANEAIDIAILQDYNKGILTESSISAILPLLELYQIPFVVDPKFDNFYAYTGATIFKPNFVELKASMPFEVNLEPTSLSNASQHVRARTGCEIVMVTLSDKGVFIDDSQQHQIIPAQKRLITDVCGAGDTVVSVAALAYAGGLDLQNIGHWSALCGTLVCQFPGVRPISQDLVIDD